MNIQTIRYIFQIIYLILVSITFLVSLKYFLILILISTIIGGVFFCGFLCPFGTMQELINQISRILNIPRIKIKQKYNRFLVLTRYILLILTTIGIIIIHELDVRVSFLDVLMGNSLSIISYIFIIGFIIIALFIDRPFCNYLCIEGARYGLFSTFRIFRIKRDEKTCINCKICDNNCPMNITISNKKYINNIQCINCFICVSKCPKKNALKYSLINPVKLIKSIFRKNK
jgi:polyferredoxin